MNFDEDDTIWAEDVQEMIDELLSDLREDEKPQKIRYQPQIYGTPWLCPVCGTDQIKTEFFNADGSEAEEKITFCWKCGQKLDWSETISKMETVR